jgi:hypothetical protein
MVIESPIAFLPSVPQLTPKLFPEIFTNERVRIQMSRVVRIFRSKELCSS